MRITLFTVEEANRVASELKPMLQSLVEAKREFDALEGRSDVLSLTLLGASHDNPDAGELRDAQERRTRLAERLTQGVQAIQRRGCLVKDLDRGLLDFYSLSGDRLIFLCWRLGENEVAHWHALEDGFEGRQRLDRSERE